MKVKNIFNVNYNRSAIGLASSATRTITTATSTTTTFCHTFANFLI